MTPRRTQENAAAAQTNPPRPPLLAPLSPHWAFVVQLREGTVLTQDGMQGRIEHIVSGQATTFASLDEARAFMAQVLAAIRVKPP